MTKIMVLRLLYIKFVKTRKKTSLFENLIIDISQLVIA